jgi:hypothetical protein
MLVGSEEELKIRDKITGNLLHGILEFLIVGQLSYLHGN